MSTETEPDYIVKPAEISAEETERARQLTIHSFIIGLLIVLMLNSGAILDMARALPFGPLRETGEALAMTWHGRMESYGLTGFHARIERRVQAFRERRWPSQGGEAAQRDRLPVELTERIEHREI